MGRLSTNELTALTYKKVKEMILSQELKPGQKIVQESLALKLGISRTPLRSALQMLEAEFLIESIPRRGVIVREFSSEKIIEVYDCRIALECMAIRLFVESTTVAKRNRLKKFFSAYSLSDEVMDEQAYQKEDAKFHDFIITNSGNSFLQRLFQQGNILLSINQIGLIRPPQETLPEHFAMIEAMVNQDVDLAESLGKEHLLKSRKRVVKRMEEQS